MSIKHAPNTPGAPPPNNTRMPARMLHLRHFTLDTAYIAPQQQTEAVKAYKRRIYVTLQTLLSATPEPAKMRVMRLWPNNDWATVWRNLQDTPVAEETKVIWYRVIHEIVPRHELLHRIRMIPTDTGRHCNKTETLRHRLTECVEGPLMWKWTQHRLALILRIDRRRIPEDWLLRPTLSLMPQNDIASFTDTQQIHYGLSATETNINPPRLS